MDGNSLNINELKISQLREIFPEIFSEGSIDLQRLKQSIGEDLFVKDEHYELSWAGKSDARKEVQKQTTATLVPERDKSIEFDKAQNIFIEGENLEVLRVLQKSYFGKVKMIYIDPPYNTGNDSFIYPDDYSERQEEYKKRTGITDIEGFLNKQDLWKKNTTENGQFHSAWLSMMYPRLYLARNLMREDGAIFISIGEEEFSNLKNLCDEIFGSENFRNTFVVRRYDKNLNRQFIEKGLKTFNVGYEYILCYAKSDNFSFNPILKESSEERMSNGYWKGFWNDANRPTMRYEVLGYTPEEGQWKWGKDKAIEGVKNYIEYSEKYSQDMTLEEYWEKTDKKLFFIRRNPSGQGKNKGVEHWIAPANGALRNTNWSDLFASKSDKIIDSYFDFPKNVDIIKNLIIGSCDEEDLILDFFAGSGTTAQAVLELNEENNLKHRFICVQIPELLEENSKAFIAGYKTIADITKLRILRVIKKMAKARTEKMFSSSEQILSISSFRLSKSNFKIWLPLISGKDEILSQLSVFKNSEIETNKDERMVIELLLKAGVGLNVPFKYENNFYKIPHLWICIERFSKQIFLEILTFQPKKVIFLNSCFTEDDELTNCQLELKENNIKLELI
ncbi:MAG: site-specific DNA-methyltransferase [Bacteroidetes bacterium]|nr:site-specific DNA-methyltransferase [Bacteroidota bacterium]